MRIFRKIRQSLLSEREFGKYFKYALGEIFLIVIGILIAVQINNWNVKNQNEKKEILYLTRLTTNLGYDIRLYQSIMQKDSMLIDSLQKVEEDVLGYLKGVTHPVEELSFLLSGYKFTANRTVIDNLVSSGQIELLRSNNLVEAIFVYYRTTDHVATSIDATMQKHNNETFSNLIFTFRANSKADSIYIDALKNSIRFKVTLIKKQIKWYNNQKNLAQKLTKKINREIELIETEY